MLPQILLVLGAVAVRSQLVGSIDNLIIERDVPRQRDMSTKLM